MNTQSEKAPRTWLRVALLLAAAAALIVALLVDRVGLGSAGSFGVGQFLLALIGVVLLMTAWLGRRVFALYRDVATILLSTLMLLACIEFAAIVAGRTVFQIRHHAIQDLPYYAAQDWTQSYWSEANVTQGYRYEPYVIWRHTPFSGELLNYDERGLRKTPGSQCGDNSYTVFTFGGSTMLGWGAPDWGTIPAYLHHRLGRSMSRPVCLVNLAEDGYGSTQGLIALMLELQAGRVPDLVIFYDGINEVIAAYESGRPSVHVTLSSVAGRFEAREAPLVTWFKTTRTYRLLQNRPHEPDGSGERLGARTPANELQDPTPLADAIADVYASNYRIAGTLAREHGFEYYFFLQPHPAASEKVLTAEEEAIVARIEPALSALARAFYERSRLLAARHERLVDISRALDYASEQLWFDPVGHITPEGNLRVAEAMLDVLTASMRDERVLDIASR